MFTLKMKSYRNLLKSPHQYQVNHPSNKMHRFHILFIVSLFFLLSMVECKGNSLNPKRFGKGKCKGTFSPSSKCGKNCEGDDYLLCNSTRGYPKKYISKLLNNSTFKEFRKYLSGGGIGAVFPQVPSAPRLRNSVAESREENYCDTEYVTIFPKIAHDNKLKPRYIVNVPETKQVVQFAKCKSTKCSFSRLAPFDYITYCKQLYSTVSLLALDQNGNIEYAKFPVPSCCVCMYKRNGDT